MVIIQIEVGSMQNFNYVIGCEASRRAAVVDPAWEVDRLLGEAARSGLTVTEILVTHTHPDHVEGLAAAQRATGATVRVHALEADRARARLSSTQQDSVRELADGQTIAVGELRLIALHTPGHTPGATCYQLPRRPADRGATAAQALPGGVVTGDTLFIGRCGRTDFPGSDPVAMFGSLRRLSGLPDDTVVYPGHNYAERPTSTIGRERVENVHMSAPDLDEFLRRRMGGAA